MFKQEGMKNESQKNESPVETPKKKIEHGKIQILETGIKGLESGLAARLANGEEVTLKNFARDSASAKAKAMLEDLNLHTSKRKQDILTDGQKVETAAKGIDYGIAAMDGRLPVKMTEDLMIESLEQTILPDSKKTENANDEVELEKYEGIIMKLLVELIIKSAESVYEVDATRNIEGIDSLNHGPAFLVTNENFTEIDRELKRHGANKKTIENKQQPGGSAEGVGAVYTFNVGGKELQYTFLLPKEEKHE